MFNKIQYLKRVLLFVVLVPQLLNHTLKAENSYMIKSTSTNRDTIRASDRKIKYMGRIDFSDKEKPLFSLPNISIKAKFQGTSIHVIIENYAGVSFSVNYFYVIVDGNEPSKLRVPVGKGEYVLATGLPNTDHTIEIIKITESDHGQCQFLGFTIDKGNMLLEAEPLPALKLEFYGNSITCGYGIDGGLQPQSDNSYKAYAATAARQLNAQFHTISYSGMGIMSGFTLLNKNVWDKIIPDSYTPAAGNNNWNFTNYTPDIVIVELGTNDYYSHIVNNPNDFELLKKLEISFIKQLRAKYHKAKIICCNSPMTNQLDEKIEGVVSALNGEGDKNVFYFGFQPMQGGGYNGHPGVDDGIRDGKALADFIKSKILQK
jgi:hypothetical protein